MPEYRRSYRPGGTFFFTIVTRDRRPLLAEPTNVQRLRGALRMVMSERPFDLAAAVILPDHLHFIWTLPENDSDYSWRIGRMKALFTRSSQTAATSPAGRDGKNGDVWQPRFWEHTIRDGSDLERHVNYLHYNPVEHGLARCPHSWPASSFGVWVRQGVYEQNWCCRCGGVDARFPYPQGMDRTVGE